MAGNYPSDILPAPSSSGYSYTVEPVATRYQMDSGRYRQTRRATAQYHNVSLNWDFTDSEYALFRGFFNSVTNYGAEWFQINLPFGGGCKGNSAQFVGGYNPSNRGILNWNVNARLHLETIDEIENQTELEAAGAPLGLVGTDWVDVFPRPSVSFSSVVEPSTVRTSMTSGRYHNRNRYKRAVHVSSIDWLLTDSEMEYFKGWHRVILGFGCSKFQLETPHGDGYQENTVNFVEGSFTATYLPGDYWTVSAQIECDKPVGIDTASEYETLVASKQANISLRERTTMGESGQGTGLISLYDGEFYSPDFLHKGGGLLPLHTGEFTSNDFAANGYGFEELSTGSFD